MLKNNKGITLVALTITIIVLLIIASVGVTVGSVSINTAKDNRLLADLDIVYHATLERYNKYILTRDEFMLPGNIIEYEEALSIAEQLEATIPNEGTYYRVAPADLLNLGLTSKESNTYIINYEKGIVFNETVKKTSEGEYLFKDNN